MDSSVRLVVERAWEQIDRDLESHVERVRTLVRQKSVSAEGLGVRECAAMLCEWLRRLGSEDAELVETGGHPVVFGELKGRTDKTLAIYMMYDTQPASEEGWSVAPFAAEVVRIAPFGRCIVGRGAKNSKGPLVAFLNAVESIKASGADLPCNLLFLMEGEEELGSVHLPLAIQKLAPRLSKAQAVFQPHAMQETDGRAVIWPGTKGLVYFELECSGQAWGRGPTEYSIHSSYKAIVDSPVWRMIHALASLTSPDGNQVTVSGFYDDVAEMTPQEARLLAELAARFSLEPFRQLWKVDRFIGEPDKLEVMKRYFYSPTLNVDGIWGGYTGPGSKTILPHRITAKLDARLVPNQRSDDILQKVRQHLDRLGFSDIVIRRLGGGEYAQTDLGNPIVESIAASYRAMGVEPEIWPRNVGFFPAYLFTDEPLRLGFCVGGLGHGGRAHGPDEYFVIDGNEQVAGLSGAEKAFVYLLFDFVERVRHSVMSKNC